MGPFAAQRGPDVAPRQVMVGRMGGDQASPVSVFSTREFYADSPPASRDSLAGVGEQWNSLTALRLQ